MSESVDQYHLDTFLDAVARRTPTPGGGAVSAAAGAMACAMARMVAAYSGEKKNSQPEPPHKRSHLTKRLERTDQLLRGLLREDACAYQMLAAAAKRLKLDPSCKSEHAAALGVALAVPMEIAAASCEALHLMVQLLPSANRHLISDLGVAAVLAQAAVRAAICMVRVNASALTNSSDREKAIGQCHQLVAQAENALARIRSDLGDLT